MNVVDINAVFRLFCLRLNRPAEEVLTTTKSHTVPKD